MVAHRLKAEKKQMQFITVPPQEQEARLIDLQYMATIETITHCINLASLANMVMEVSNPENCYYVI